MNINENVITADFDINSNLTIRYKKDYGFWLLIKRNNMFYVVVNSFMMNPFGLGLKIRRGFGYDDMKQFFFKTFDEALETSTKCDDFPFCEYNQETHFRIGDTHFRKEDADEKITKLLTDILTHKTI